MLTGIACLAFLVSAAWLAVYHVDCSRQARRSAALAAVFHQAALREAFLPAGTDERSEQPVQNRFELLRSQNRDALGWLTISALGLEEPVVAGRDNRYYLRHDFDGAASRLGTLFLDRRNTFADNNLCVYGHAAGNGSMFGGLKAYRDEAFLRMNPRILLDTPDGTGEWVIFAVLLADPGDPDGYFAWQREALAGSMSAEDFATRVRSHAIAVGETDIDFADTRFLSLVTCAYDFADARLVAVAAECP